MPGYTRLNLSYLSHILSCTSMIWLTPSFTQVASYPSFYLGFSLCSMEYLLNRSKEWITDWHVSLLKWLRKLFPWLTSGSDELFLWSSSIMLLYSDLFAPWCSLFTHDNSTPHLLSWASFYWAQESANYIFPESLGSQVLITSCQWKYSWEIRRYLEEKSLLTFLSKHCGNCGQLLFFARGGRLPVRFQEVRLR